MAKIILFNFEAGAAKKTGIAETLSKKARANLFPLPLTPVKPPIRKKPPVMNQ